MLQERHLNSPFLLSANPQHCVTFLPKTKGSSEKTEGQKGCASGRCATGQRFVSHSHVVPRTPQSLFIFHTENWFSIL